VSDTKEGSSGIVLRKEGLAFSSVLVIDQWHLLRHVENLENDAEIVKSTSVAVSPYLYS
jgi:hypothetical protein